MLPLLSLKPHDGQQTDGFLFRGKRKVAPPSAPEPAPEPSPEQDALAALWRTGDAVVVKQ
jgi:hypothetical protein